MTTPVRNRLPSTRKGLIHRFTVGIGAEAVSVYVETGVYEDGRIGEVFLKADRQGTLVSGLLDGISLTLSLSLQYGVPLQEVTAKLRGTRFEPQGQVEGSVLGPVIATSILDYLARWLDDRYGVKEQT